MTARSMMDVHAALSRGAHEEILGCPEGRDLDFKRDVYALGVPRKKWELAKDVAAFANTGGGLIVVGVRTERRDNHTTEAAVALCPVRKDLVDLNKYRDAIANGVTPLVEGIELRWFPEDVQIENGILTIYVPNQTDRSKPFVLRRIIDEGGSEIAAFAVPRRNEDRTEWLSADHVQTQLALLGVATRATSAQEPTSKSESLDERVVDLVRELGASEEPCLALQLVPPAAVDLSLSLFGEQGIVSLLRQWKGIRPMGFDLESHAEPQPRGSSVLFGGDRWRGRIDGDGTLQLVLPVRPDFLGWAMNKGAAPTDPVRINAVPMVEVVYDFFRLAHALVVPRTMSRAWTARTRAWRMQSGRVLMHAGRRSADAWFSAKSATSDDYAPAPFTIAGGAERDAFECLARIYVLWGLGPDDIPFATDGQIDPDAIVTLKG